MTEPCDGPVTTVSVDRLALEFPKSSFCRTWMLTDLSDVVSARSATASVRPAATVVGATVVGGAVVAGAVVGGVVLADVEGVEGVEGVAVGVVVGGVAVFSVVVGWPVAVGVGLMIAGPAGLMNVIVVAASVEFVVEFVVFVVVFVAVLVAVLVVVFVVVLVAVLVVVFAVSTGAGERVSRSPSRLT